MPYLHLPKLEVPKDHPLRDLPWTNVTLSYRDPKRPDELQTVYLWTRDTGRPHPELLDGDHPMTWAEREQEEEIALLESRLHDYAERMNHQSHVIRDLRDSLKKVSPGNDWKHAFFVLKCIYCGDRPAITRDDWSLRPLMGLYDEEDNREQHQ